MLSIETQQKLLTEASTVAYRAYAPYSNFRVGAALLCSDGTIVTGTNIENRSYGLTLCAERVAICTSLTQGKKDFLALAVVCIDADYPVSPCGACRQVLSEFVSKDFPILFSSKGGEVTITTLQELFPYDALHHLRKKV